MQTDPQFQTNLEAAGHAYSDHLHEQLHQLETTWQQFLQARGEGHVPFQALQTIVHNLHGQGTFFGYPEITRIAEELDSWLDNCTAGIALPTQDIQSAIQHLISQLQYAALVDQEQHMYLFREDTITAISEYKETVLRLEVTDGKIIFYCAFEI